MRGWGLLWFRVHGMEMFKWFKSNDQLGFL